MGAAWVDLVAILCHVWAFLGVHSQNLGAFRVHCGRHASCKVEVDDLTKDLEALLRVRGSRHLTYGFSYSGNVDFVCF